MLHGRSLLAFRKQLLEWFGEFQRDLPWRRTKAPYRIWLSEIMLQQTRVAVVIPYYQRFLEHFPDIKALAGAPPEDVLRLWSGLGYYSRARNLQRAAQQIAAGHGGNFPSKQEDVLALPGIGRYTAAAILSIAFGAKHAVLDGNVARVLARIGALRGDLRETKRWAELQEAAGKLLAPGAPGDWNQAMMELGATLCTPRAPQCLLCPVAKFCRARQLGLAEALPEKRRKRATVEVTLAAAVFVDFRGHTLVLPPPGPASKQAAPNDVASLVSRMWHFPATPVHENPATELQRYLSDLLPATAKRSRRLDPVAKIRHAVTYRAITVLPFRIQVTKLPRVSGAHTLLLADLSSVPVSNLTRKIARAALKNPPAPASR
jgi:A/G-specific adenine glycosylase